MFDARTQVTKVMIFSLFQSIYLLLVDPYNFPYILFLSFPSSSIDRVLKNLSSASAIHITKTSALLTYAATYTGI